MDATQEIAKAKELLDKSQDVLVVTHENPTHDSIGSTLALYLALQHLGKNVTVACPDPITVELSSYVGANKVMQDIGKKNFIISLDYVDGSIEKVSYNIEGDKFNLVIEPRPGFDTFSSDKAHYSYSGATADIIFAIDTIHLGGLRKLYEGEKNLFASKPIVNVDRHPNNAHFGQVNLTVPTASSTAELVGELLVGLDIQWTEDIATNVLNALYGGTNNFGNPVQSARAFELAAACVRAGGRKFRKMVSAEELPKMESAALGYRGVPQEAPVIPTVKPTEAPADWLKPKIFKSSNPA